MSALSSADTLELRGTGSERAGSPGAAMPGAASDEYYRGQLREKVRAAAPRRRDVSRASFEAAGKAPHSRVPSFILRGFKGCLGFARTSLGDGFKRRSADS